jgi:DNA-binding transcriptional regulator YiaG
VKTKTKFSDELRQWREWRKMLQKEAADALRVPLDTYRQWEQGQSTPHESPSYDEIRRRMEAAK